MENRQGELVEIRAEYYGSEEEDGTFFFQKYRTFQVEGEGVRKGDYEPGNHQRPSINSPFAWSSLRVIQLGTKELLMKQVGQKYTCSNPQLTYDEAATNSRKRVREALEKAISAAPTNFWEAKKVEQIFVLARWFDKIFWEHPEMDPSLLDLAYTHQIKDKNQILLKLFSDRHFRPVFGKAFSQLTDKDKEELLAAIQLLLKGNPRLRPYQKERKEEAYLFLIPWQESLFRNAFSDCPNNSRIYLCTDRIKAFTTEQNNQLSQLDQIQKRLDGDPKRSLSLLLNDWSAHNALQTLWPSDKAPLSRALANRIHSQAALELAEWVKNLEAQPSSLAGLKEIEAIASTPAYRYSAEEAQQLAEVQLGQKAKQIIVDLMKTESNTLRTIDLQADPITASNRWYADFSRNYQERYGHQTAVQQVYKSYFNYRKQWLKKMEPQFHSELAAAKSESALNQIVAKFLQPENEQTTITLAYRAAIDQRRTAIIYQTRPVIGTYTAADILRISMQTTPTGEPTEEQMKLALFKYYAGVNEQIDQMANTNSTNPVEMLLGLFAQSAQQFKISVPYFEKLACQKSQNKP
ncbi:MAG: hypothetical protein KDC44_15220, partial [Phaeodactylibacter sp.]|nr:hypothetical protein [Phaeodactylibacter sp.]